jgi:hypothetical protein
MMDKEESLAPTTMSAVHVKYTYHDLQTIPKERNRYELSTETEERDRGFKFKRYVQEKVSEYGIVDAANQRIEVYSQPERGFILFSEFRTGQTLRTKLFPELQCSVGEVWA